MTNPPSELSSSHVAAAVSPGPRSPPGAPRIQPRLRLTGSDLIGRRPQQPLPPEMLAFFTLPFTQPAPHRRPPPAELPAAP